MRFRNVAHALVKLFDRPVSKGRGTVKLGEVFFESTARERLEGGAERVLVASWSWDRGGMNSATCGGGRVSSIREDGIQARSGSTALTAWTDTAATGASRGPCG
jgi:hypothetical protein